MPDQQVPALLTAFVGMILIGSAAAWSWAANRWQRGLSLVPYYHRRQVPWSGIMVVSIMLLFILMQLLSVGLAIEFSEVVGRFTSEQASAEPAVSDDQPERPDAAASETASAPPDEAPSGDPPQSDDAAIEAPEGDTATQGEAATERDSASSKPADVVSSTKTSPQPSSEATPDAPALDTPPDGDNAAADITQGDVEPASEEAAKSVAPHPIVQFLDEYRDNPLALIFALVAGVIVAPLAEEFLFRVVLQGWLEARERQWRRTKRTWRDLPMGTLSVVVPAVLFGAVHFRAGEAESSAENLVPLLIGNTVGTCVFLTVSMFLLLGVARANPRDLGLDARKAGLDTVRGLVAMLMAIVPLYIVQFSLQLLLDDLPGPKIAADPVPLTMFALVSGYLYFRTHRLWPSATLHVAFNALPLFMLVLNSNG